MSKEVFASLAITASVGSAARAQDAPMAVTRGTVLSVSPLGLEVMGRNGQTVVVALTGNSKVLAATAAGIEDVKPNSYVGAAAAPQPDGTLKAWKSRSWTRSCAAWERVIPAGT